MINYEGKDNPFLLISEIKTELKYGDIDNIKNPFLTVLIPTYSRVDTLEDAIESVLKQKQCDFLWDIVVLDNEEEDGKPNDTEALIRRINSRRILYYRNSHHVRPGDNFNIGLMIARGKWVCFLHDDDLLISNSLFTIGTMIRELDKPDKPLGAISARNHQFTYLVEKKRSIENLSDLDKLYSNSPVDYGLYKLTHKNIWFTSMIGGDVPSNGTTYNRKAAIEAGGFNEEYGISGDLILFYRMENKYAVYSTNRPMGLYRWGNNSMMKQESTIRVLNDGYLFREYVYSKSIFNRLMGCLFRKCHARDFTQMVLESKNRCLPRELRIKKEDLPIIYVKEPSVLGWVFYKYIMQRKYYSYKMTQCIRLNKKIRKRILLRGYDEGCLDGRD